jgi:RNA polymerase sigma-70 factor, ECF subfamily
VSDPAGGAAVHAPGPGPAPGPDDAELLRLTVAGDEGAFARFVDRHQAGVWRRALTLTDHGSDAEDLLQETFLAAWRGAASFRGGSARSWLLTIAAHAWQRMGRQAARLQSVGDDESLEGLALRAGWGEIDDVPDGRVTIVQQAFARLSDDDRRLLTLRDIEETSGESVAELLGLTLPAMKSRLHRARLRLAAAYEEVRRGSA